MKSIKEMTQGELAAFIQSHLWEKGIDFVEFPPGPLAVGVEPVKQVNELKFSTGMLRIISPTDCVKDRLAGY